MGYLVGAADEVEVVGLQELREHVLPEDVADTTLLILVPALLLENGVGPEQVAEHALAGDIGGPVEREDLLEFYEFRGDASVHAEDLLLDDGRDGHGVEGVDEVLPDLEGELALACVGRCLHSS